MLSMCCCFSNALRKYYFLRTLLHIVLTAPVDIYATWIDELEKVNANPGDLDDIDHDENSEISDQDDYSFICFKNHINSTS